MPTVEEMRAARAGRAPTRQLLIATPMRKGGGYTGETTDMLCELANERGGWPTRGIKGLIRDYATNQQLSRARLVANWMHFFPQVSDFLFLDADNAMDLETFDALMRVDGDVVCVPYLRREAPHVWTVRLDRSCFEAPRLREQAGERLLSVPMAATGVMRVTRAAMRRVWDAHPDLRGDFEYETGMHHPDGMIACFNGVLCDEPTVDMLDGGDLAEVKPPLPFWLDDDYGFCMRARKAGLRVEVLCDRWAKHDGIYPVKTLAQQLWGDSARPARRA